MSVLVICDINHFLCDRRWSPISEREPDMVNYNPDQNDSAYARNYIYFRPELDRLIDFFNTNKRLEIAFWTSGTKPVLSPIIEYVKSKLYNPPVFVWYRDMCTLTGVNHKTYKDLSKIEYNAKYIIMLDDDITKFKPEHQQYVTVVDAYYADKEYDAMWVDKIIKKLNKALT